MTTVVKEEHLKLNRNISGISEADIAVSTGEGMQDIWSYKVPVGHVLVFRPTDTFAAYLDDSTGAEADAGSSVAIDKTDASKQARQPILNQLRYTQIKDFTDKDKLVHLDIDPGEEIRVNEGEWVIIKGNIGETLDASDSYFELTCHRIRRTLHL